MGEWTGTDEDMAGKNASNAKMLELMHEPFKTVLSNKKPVVPFKSNGLRGGGGLVSIESRHKHG